MFQKNKCFGFTLIEVLIAISVSAILLMVITNIFKVTASIKHKNIQYINQTKQFSNFYNIIFTALKNINNDTELNCLCLANQFKINYNSTKGNDILNIKFEMYDNISNAYIIKDDNEIKIYNAQGKLKFEYLINENWFENIELKKLKKLPELIRLIDGNNGVLGIWQF